MIPFIDLKPYVNLIRTPMISSHAWNFDELVSTILAHHDFINGPHTTKLEVELNKQLGTQHAIACASGTSALTLALAAHGIDHTFTVAMPNVTFFATYEAVAHSGALPLLIDIDPNDLQMSFDEFKAAHDRHRFKAAVLPHLFGWCSARLGDFRDLCEERNIILIEDGAQAFGVEYKGESVFAHADTITLSFFPAKVIGGIMDGGAVLVNSSRRTADTVRLLANHGRTGHYEHKLVGWNSRMSEINAAWLLRALAKSKEILADRNANLSRYHGLRATRLAPDKVTGNGYLALTMCGAPTVGLTAKLAKIGIGSARIYPSPISAQPAATRALEFGELKNSYVFCTFVINLPLYYGMAAEDVATASHALKGVLGGQVHTKA